VVPPQRGAAARGPRHRRGRALRAGRRGSGRRPRATDRLRDHRGAHPVRHGDGVHRAGHRGRLRPPLRRAQETRRDAPAVLGDHRGEDRRDAGPGRRAEHPARSDRGRPGWRPDPAGLGVAVVLIALGSISFSAMGLLLGGTLKAEIVLALANLIWFLLIGAAGLAIGVADLPAVVHDLLVVVPSYALTS